ncbi:class I SAM-dependent methyltransferase [Pseudomonas sp. LRF_L74]|uniref:class I SAM-dependent methyltransferase n=1 Tax=Pseudomonas sp. LRF_L74 TaxID=3369422 RepID=UPI003F5EF039
MNAPAQDRRVNLGPVQETLLIPLFGRAQETSRRNGMLQDPKAVEIVAALDYDFDKWRNTPSLAGACLRTRMFDEHVQDFLAQHPAGTVVEIGCGLNTRFERLDNGLATWFELDLPDSMALRQRFFHEQPRRHMLACDLQDNDWMDDVANTGGPWCFVSEAVVIYLEEDQVKNWVKRLNQRFPGAWLLTDTTARRMVEGQAAHDTMSTLGVDSWFRWACDDPAQLAGWGLKLIDSRTFLDAPRELLERLPLSWRVLMRWTPWLIRGKLEAYRMNRFELLGV